MEMDKEKIIQLQIMEQEANQLDQQLQLIEKHNLEMQKLNESLDELEKTKEKNLLANIGKGIYIPVEMKDEKLIVEVGNKHFVKKSIPDTKKIIGEQIKKLEEIKIQILARAEELQTEMISIINSLEQCR